MAHFDLLLDSLRRGPGESLSSHVRWRGVPVDDLTGRSALALATLVAALPVAAVYVFSQRALVRGLVGGASKG